jgi:hypothetical protein
MKHTYYANLDIAKSVLALLVVSLHVFLGAVNPRLYPVLNPVTRLAVPTFFILSSYFFFRKVNKTPKHMVGKLLINAERRYIELYMFWLIVLLPITLRADQGLFSSVKQFLTQLLLNSTFADSWYIMALILAIPIVFGLSRFCNNYILGAFGLVTNVLCMLLTNYANTDIGINIANYWYALPVRLYPYQAFTVAILWVVVGKLFADNNLKVTKRSLWKVGLGISFIGLYAEQYLVLHMGWNKNGDSFLMLIPTCIFLFGLISTMSAGRSSGLWLHAFATVTYCLHGSLLRVVNMLAAPLHYQIVNNFDRLAVWFIVILTCALATLVITRLETFKGLHWLHFAH